jgi:hypothetical protein
LSDAAIVHLPHIIQSHLPNTIDLSKACGSREGASHSFLRLQSLAPTTGWVRQFYDEQNRVAYSSMPHEKHGRSLELLHSWAMSGTGGACCTITLMRGESCTRTSCHRIPTDGCDLSTCCRISTGYASRIAGTLCKGWSVTVAAVCAGKAYPDALASHYWLCTSLKYVSSQVFGNTAVLLQQYM